MSRFYLKFFRPVFICNFFLLFLFQQNISAQENATSKYSYPVPSQLEASKKFTFNTCPLCLVEKIFPIGWSKDGKFAFAVEPVDEACGCYFFELKIIDAKTDSLLWGYSYGSDDGGKLIGFRDSVVTHKEYLSLQKIWLGQYKLFSETLNQFKIIPGSTFTFHSFIPFTTKDTLTLKINGRDNPSARPYSDSDYVDSIMLIKKGDEKNPYLVKAEYIYKEPINIPVQGYLKSPYENCGVILLIYEEEGWEGPPEIYVYHVIGFK